MKDILLSSVSFDVAFDCNVRPYVMALLLIAPSGALADGKFNGSDVSDVRKSAAHFSGKPRPEHTARTKKPVAATTPVKSTSSIFPAIMLAL